MGSTHQFTLQLIPHHDTFGNSNLLSLFTTPSSSFTCLPLLTFIFNWDLRLKPGCEDCLEEIEAEVKCKPQKLEWLPGFYSLPPHIQIAGTKAYQEGKVSLQQLPHTLILFSKY